MHDYKNLLILLYFAQVQDNYDYTELRQIMGMTKYQLEERLIYLKEEGLLYYNNFLLEITKEGLTKLNSNYILLNNDNSVFSEDDYNYAHIDKSKAISISDIYIPKNFQEKI